MSYNISLAERIMVAKRNLSKQRKPTLELVRRQVESEARHWPGRRRKDIS